MYKIFIPFLLSAINLVAMGSDLDANDDVLNKIEKFNDKYPSKRIRMKTLRDSMRARTKKENQTEHGLYIDPRLVDLLSQRDYLTRD
jgi:hypothetical protein